MEDSFNPHPARRLDAIVYAQLTTSQTIKVSILIQPEGWMLFWKRQKESKRVRFQSSSSPKAGCYLRINRELQELKQVSILIQPEGWML